MHGSDSWFLLTISAFCVIFRQIYGHECGHIAPQPHEVVHGVHIEPHHVMRKRAVDQPLRIHLVYDGSISGLPEQQQHLVKNDLIPSAVAFWEDTLMVRETVGPIKLLRQCRTERVRYQEGDPHPFCVDGCAEITKCGETEVPEKHLDSCRVGYIGSGLETKGKAGEGVVSTDFILYISAHTTDRCKVGTTVAYAAYCQLEGALDRPVAGYVNLCPESISTKAHDIHQMHSTIKHEILHALGFSAGLYAFFRDKEGNPLTPRLAASGKPEYNKTLQLHQWSDKIIKTVTRPVWMVRTGKIKKTVSMIVTPRVVEEVREHFGCPELEGAELEDQGVTGTAVTHWEKRVFENEAMTGTYTQNPVLSRVSLALMEDTGWYSVKYSNADDLKWGKNLGCDFVKKSCFDWIESRKTKGQHIHPFCDRVKTEALQTECTEPRDAVALCNLVEYTGELPPQYQHFYTIAGVADDDVGKYAGSVSLADYCPYIQEFNWKKGEEIIRGSRCNIFQNNIEEKLNYALESYGNQSRCFDHGGPWRLKRCTTDHVVEHWGSGCYQYECAPSTGLSVLAGGQKHRCYRAGQQITVRSVSSDWLHDGVIICPPCSEICEPDGMPCPPDISPPQKSEQVVIETPCNLATRHVTPTLTLLTLLAAVNL